MELPFCRCGCGEHVTKARNRFVWTHQSRGVHNPNHDKKASAETRRKMSEAHKGKRHYAWGKKLSEEHRRKISESERGKKLSEEHKRAIVRYQKGKPTSAITRQKMSEAAKGEGNPFYGRRG